MNISPTSESCERVFSIAGHYLSCSQISQTECYKQSDAVFMHSFQCSFKWYALLLSVLHFKTILLVDLDWLLKVLPESAVGVLKSNTASKMEHSIWKSNKNWTGKWCQIVCCILFDLLLCMTSSAEFFSSVCDTFFMTAVSFYQITIHQSKIQMVKILNFTIVYLHINKVLKLCEFLYWWGTKVSEINL